jgi:methyl-accepting chemotaxis protein
VKIGIRLALIISIFNLIGIGLLAGVAVTLSEREISRLADGQAKSLAVQSGEKISAWFGDFIGLTRNLARIMEGYDEIPVTGRRWYFNLMLKKLIGANPQLTSVYVNWAPDMLDGMDAEYANTPGTDGSGRFIPAWAWLNNEVILTPIAGFNWEMTRQAIGTSAEYVFDPSLYPALNRNILIANMGTSVKDKDKWDVVAAVGCTVELSTIQNIVSEIKPFGDGFALLFSSGGIVAAHRDPERLGRNMLNTESDTFGPWLETMADAVSAGTPVSFSYQPEQSDTVIQYYSASFTIGNTSNPWTLVIGVSRDAIMAPVYRMLFICAVICIFSIVLMSLGAVINAHSISRPIVYTMTALKDIAEGDLTKEITIRSRDELGDFAHHLNLTVCNIRNLVLSIRKEASSILLTGVELSDNVDRTAVSINEITANIESITAQSEKQEMSVDNTGKTMEEIVENIQTLNTLIQKQTDCVSQSSASVEQMLANIQSVTRSLLDNEGNVTSLALASEAGQDGLREVSADIKEIERESEGLLGINSVMQTIASQTNLLSMNAAIEAAHAGEAGKGFAVVADEIRKLAESSSKQSKTIGGVLARIKGSIDKITRSTEAALLKFEAINNGIRDVTDREANVRGAMEEQAAGSQSILESINSLTEISGEVTNRAQSMGGRSQEIIGESQTLERITSEINGGMNDMAAGAGQINEAVKRVGDISADNKKQIDALIAEVSKFKV